MKKALSKIILTLAVVFYCLGTTLLLTACGSKFNGNELLKVYVKQGSLSTKVELDDQLDTSKVVLMLELMNHIKYEIPHDNLTIDESEVDTTKAGTYDLKISYNYKIDENLTYTGNHVEKIKVRQGVDIVSVMDMSSALLTEYVKNSGEQSNKEEEFVNIDTSNVKTITVGDDNEFNFRINATGLDEDGEPIEDLEIFRTNVTIKHNGETLPAENDYVTVNTATTVFKFKEAAVGETFEVTVAAANPVAGYNVSPFKANLKVVDGFNVYNAHDLAVYDNSVAHKNWYAPLKEEWGLTGITPKAIILQNNILAL